MGCSSTEDKVNALQSAFDQKPTVKTFKILRKYYKKKKMIDQEITLYERYLQAFPKKIRIKKGLGRAYSKKGMTLTGEQRYLLLKKALEYGYKNDHTVGIFSKLVEKKLMALAEQPEKKLTYLQEIKHLPMNSTLRIKLNESLDYLKNRKGFEHYFKKLKVGMKQKKRAFSKVLKSERITFNPQSELFTVTAIIPFSRKGGFNKNVSQKMIDSKIDVLKYALEHFKKPPMDQEIQVIPLEKDAVVCDEGKRVKKQFVRTCTVSLQEIARTFFALRKQQP